MSESSSSRTTICFTCRKPSNQHVTQNHIIHGDDSNGRFSAYYWIRDNTDPDSVVLVPQFYPLKSFKYANVLLERMIYVRKAQFTYVDNISAYGARVNDLRAIYRNDTSLEEYQMIIERMELELPRSLYAL